MSFNYQEQFEEEKEEDLNLAKLQKEKK